MNAINLNSFPQIMNSFNLEIVIRVVHNSLIIIYNQVMQNSCITVILLAFTLQIANSWTQYTDIRTGRVDLYNSITSGGLLTSSSLPQSYNITYTKTISQTMSSGIGIVGFQTYVTTSFSINMTINNFMVTTMRITGIAQDDTIVTFLSINYIAVGSLTYFLEVQFYCFLPTILSTGSGSRSQTKTSTATFSNSVLSCKLYLSGFRLTNSVGINNYLLGSVSSPSGTSALNYVFSTTENNLVTQICYTTVIFCEACTKSSKNYLEWGQIGQTYLSNTLLPSASNIGTSATLSTRYENDNRMFWGIDSFNVSRGFNRGFNFQTNYYTFTGKSLDTNYSTFANLGTYQISLNHFFIATRDCNSTNNQWFQVPTQTCQTNTCWSNLTYSLNGTNDQFCNYCDYTCLTCDGSLSTNCSTCSNTSFRYLNSNTCPCQTGYIDVGLAACYPCEYYISGCLTCSSSSVCTSCSSGFTVSQLGLCQCTTGFLVTGVCTTIKGCLSATNFDGSIYCTLCDGTLNYVRSTNFTCLCQTGFSMDSAQDCISMCGDSITVGGQACDDGNLINGDGCSDQCQVQANFHCDNSDPPSECFITATITATVKYVERVLTANQAIFAIDLQPEFDQYPNMDFSGYVSTDVPCTQSTYVYLESLLIFTCSYSKTIEGSSYTFNLTLDPRYFASGTNVSIVLPASGMNAKLTSDSNYAMHTLLKMTVLILDMIAIIVLLISCVTQRMIGVEMIQTLQSVLYAMALMKTCPSTLAPLQSLRYSNGFNELSGTDSIRRYTYTFAIGQVGLDKEFLLNYNISYLILMIVIVLLLFFKVLVAKFELDKVNEQKQFNRKIQMDQIHKSYKKIKKAYKIIFERVLFVLCFMNMFLIIFAVSIQFSDLQQAYSVMGGQFNFLFCAVAICILVTFLTMVIINGCYPMIRLFPMFMNQKYPVYYVIYNSTFIFLISYLYPQKWVLFVLLAMVIINLIYSIVYEPYREKLDNLTLAFNQATIVIAVATYLYEESTEVTNNNEGIFTILVIIITLMLYVCVFLSIYRLYRFYQYMKINKLSYYDDGFESQRSQKNAKLPKNDEQIDIQMMDNDKIEGLKTSKALQPFQREMYDDSKLNKGPLNAARFNNDNVETNREKNSIAKSRLKNEQNYDTFSKNKSKDNTFQIEPIDPNPREVRGQKSPYNQFGQLKLHNKKDEEEQRDALKEIKARLRKDFYHKVRQTQYKEVSQREQLLDKKKDKPVNFEPSDYHDDE